MKIDRLLAIIMLLINKKKVTAKELAEHFEVSIRTIQRDMDHLTMAGIPIYSDVGKSGGYQLVDDYRLDKNFLNKSEASLLMAFLKNVKDTVPYEDAKNMASKLETLLPNEEEEKVVFRVNPSMAFSSYQRTIQVLTRARDKKKKTLIHYVDAQYRETQRIICPYRIVIMGSVGYVYAYCEQRHDFRMFKVSRISQCEMLEDTYELMPLPEEVPWDNLMVNDREPTDIILELDLCLKGTIPDYFDYRSCKVLEDKIVVSIAFPVDEWLYSILLSLVPHIKVVEPKWVREEMIGRLVRGIEKMKN